MKYDHCILLHKLVAMGFGHVSVEWFRAYLSNRAQIVDISGTHSSLASIKCGVPQGSILGPLLFLLYVNDMQGAVLCKLLLYADDSAIIVSHKDLEFVQNQLSAELTSVN